MSTRSQSAATPRSLQVVRSEGGENVSDFNIAYRNAQSPNVHSRLEVLFDPSAATVTHQLAFKRIVSTAQQIAMALFEAAYFDCQSMIRPAAQRAEAAVDCDGLFARVAR